MLSARAKTIKMNGKKCKYSGSDSVFDCHCNECRDNIVEYLGKKIGETYKYTGKFAPAYMYNQEVIIDKFSTTAEDKTSSCEAVIKLKGGTGGQVEGIPREEIINNLEFINDNNLKLNMKNSVYELANFEKILRDTKKPDNCVGRINAPRSDWFEYYIKEVLKNLKDMEKEK